MDQMPSSADNPRPQNQNFDKTIDESAMSIAQNMGMQQGATGTKIYNPYQPNTLPTGNEPVKVGSGKIVGVLGTGGMAKVYKIWNEKLEVYRAVKILLPSNQKDLTNRFETEAKITAKLHHPNIVEIYNVGDWNGLPYIEMEIIEGVTLDTLISGSGKLPNVVICAICIQVARALSYAHGQEFLIYGKNYNGIIHRDLKPANIMINTRGNIKLMDFGIARPTEAGLHTMEGHIVGTLQYLSPEQLDGVAIDKRSDLYSFGAIIYEMLTGIKTFPQATITNLMKMKATNAYRKFNEFDFSINTSLAKISEKCLQQNRDNRYGSSNLLLKDLNKAFSAFTSQTPEELLQEYVENPDQFKASGGSKKSRSKVIMYAGIGAALLAIIGGGIFYLLQNPPQADNSDQGQSAQVVNPTPLPARKPQPIVENPPEPQPPALDQDLPLKEQPIEQSSTRPQRPVAPQKRPEPQQTQIHKPSPNEGTNNNQVSKPAPIDALRNKYSLNDPVEIGVTACRKGNYTDAVTALLEVTPGHPEFAKRNQFLLWSFVETHNLAGAREIAATVPQNDAFILLLLGRIEEASGNDKKAIDYYDAALTKPSKVKEINDVRNEALYLTALVYDKHYVQSPSAEARFKAISAWNNVKRVYTATTDHPRFKMANKKLSEY